MDDLELVTIEEFVQQVWEIEHCKVELHFDEYPDRLVRPYNYSRLPNDATVSDLHDRIHECVRPFVYHFIFRRDK